MSYSSKQLTADGAAAGHKESDPLARTGIVVLIALFCDLLWGSAFPCIKVGYAMMHIDSADTASQILYAGERFMISGVLAILISSVMAAHSTGQASRGRKIGGILVPDRSNFHKVLIIASMQTVGQYLLFYIGLAHTAGVKASIMEGAAGFVLILLSTLVFRREKMTGAKLLGCVLGFGGVILVNITGGSYQAGFRLNGEGFILLSTLCYAVAAIQIKEYSKTDNAVLISSWQFLVGGLIMALIGKLMGGQVSGFTPASALLLIYMGFISAAAYTLWNVLLAHNPVSRVAVFGFMNPVFGAILSALILGEGSILGIKSAAALLLVSLGIWTVNRESSGKERS